MKDKLQADVSAEIAKLAGKEIPVSYSLNLKNSDKFCYTVAPVKIIEERGEPKLAIALSAKDDFTIPSMKAYDYMVYYRLVGADGATLAHAKSAIIFTPLAREVKSFKKGEALTQTNVGLNLGRYAADRVAFSGIEFITAEEYNAKEGA